MILYDYFENDTLDHVQTIGHVNHEEFKRACFKAHRSVPARIQHELDKNKKQITVGYYKLY